MVHLLLQLLLLLCHSHELAYVLEKLYVLVMRHVGQLLLLLCCQLEQQSVQLSPFSLL